MPEGWEEFAADELRLVLAESAARAEGIMDLAHDLEVKLPGTRAAFRDGILRESKAAIIAAAAALLDPAEARAAEALVLDRAGRLTPGGLRAAIGRAVMQVAPDKARRRREAAEKDARVQRWVEDSGNAALMGRELPPAEVLAADQRITAWAHELRKAGLDGSMDELRARAYLDILLDKDSRPRPEPAGAAPATGTAAADATPEPGGTAADGADGGTDGADDGRDGTDGPDGGGSGPAGPGGPGTPGPGGTPSGVIPAGFAGKVTLTVPLDIVTGRADRPGEIGGIGPVDPWLARDLATAAAQNPRSTFCVTVTDQDGHAIGHGCARPEPRSHRTQRRSGRRDGRDPPGGARDGPGFAFTPAGQPGPPGGYGTWRLRTGGAGPDLLVTLDPIATGGCDHRFEAQGHDPGVKLRHLTQIRHATCTGPGCRRPSTQADFEHNIAYEAGGRTCMCNGNPACRHDHRLKQHPRWKAEQITPATVRWTTPSGRQWTTEPTRYPV
jgi:hypothetical protein